MTTLRKLNRIVSVTDNELNKYLAKGYEVVNQPQPQVQVEADKPEVTPSAPQPEVEPNRIVVQSEVVAEESTTPTKRTKRRR